MIPNPPNAGSYQVIYADPPWNFRTYSKKGMGRNAEAYYDTMSLKDIADLPVSDWAASNCVLLMWTTDPMLEKSFAILRSWGFTYKTVGFYWAKLNKSAGQLSFDERSFFTGMGFWTRANPEQCLLATRGKPKRIGTNVRKLMVSPRREHSRKPDEIYDRIEALVDGPYLEMFARSDRAGWDSWGSEVGTFQKQGAPKRRWKSTGHPEEKKAD